MRFIYSTHIIQVFSFVCVLTWSLLGVKKSSKFSTSIPTPFICGVHSPPRGGGKPHLAENSTLTGDDKKLLQLLLVFLATGG